MERTISQSKQANTFYDLQQILSCFVVVYLPQQVVCKSLGYRAGVLLPYDVVPDGPESMPIHGIDLNCHRDNVDVFACHLDYLSVSTFRTPGDYSYDYFNYFANYDDDGDVCPCDDVSHEHSFDFGFYCYAGEYICNPRGLHPGEVCIRGDLHAGRGLARPSPLDTTGYNQRAGGALPTGMHSCLM